MTIKKWVQIILVSSSILTLAACSSAHKNRDEVAINDANAAYSENAQASGLGDEAGFGDEGSSKHLAANQRVYYFDFDSNVVHDQDKPAISAHATHLAANPSAKVMLEGHTDPRGSREYNVGLGERRAKAVADLMTSKGVNPSQVRIVSYGAEKLASTGRSESDFQQDRRAVLSTSQR